MGISSQYVTDMFADLATFKDQLTWLGQLCIEITCIVRYLISEVMCAL